MPNSYMNYEESWEDNKEIHVLAGTNRKKQSVYLSAQIYRNRRKNATEKSGSAILFGEFLKCSIRNK